MAIMDQEAVAAVTKWGNLSPVEMEELLSWTGVPAGEIRMRFRGETFGSRSLRNPVMRGCRKCLAEDAQRNPGTPLKEMAIRGDWLFRDVTICLEHRLLLTDLWTEPTPARRFDIGERLSEIASGLQGDLQCHREHEPSDYDLWLAERLTSGTDPTWLAGHALQAVTTTCGLLGAAMKELQPASLKADPDLRAMTLATGFSALSPGVTAFRETLDALVARADGPLALPQKAFGQLYAKLARDLVDDADIAPFRAEVRETILSNWPYASGEVLLGEPVAARRLHSVVSAAQTLGMMTPAVDAILTAAGAFASDDARAPNRKIFSANSYAELLEEIPTWVGPGVMMASMGITKRAFASLEEDGVLTPRTKAPKVIGRWRQSDGQALLDQMRAVSHEFSVDESGWESIQHAKKRKGVPVGQLISLALSGKIALGRVVGIDGYNGFRVCTGDIDALAEEMADTATGPEGLTQTISAAAFGRSVGLRDGGHFQRLIEAGYVLAQKVKHPKTHTLQWRMTPADVAAFHRKFLTTSTIEAEFGLHRNRILALLNAAGARPFTLDGMSIGSVWFRDEVQHHFKTR